jgi:hypothetical protein
MKRRMNHRTAGRIVGALFLAAFLFYGIGSALGASPVGIALIILNSMAVIVIGILMRARFAPDAPRAAEGYLWGRTIEAALLGAGIWFLLTEREIAVDLLYAAAMVALAAGSVPLFLALTRLGLIPRWFGRWAVIGYVLLALGAVLEFVQPGIGIALAIPGGLFEIGFAILLLRVGFPAGEPSVGGAQSEASGV